MPGTSSYKVNIAHPLGRPYYGRGIIKCNNFSENWIKFYTYSTEILSQVGDSDVLEEFISVMPTGKKVYSYALIEI